MSRSEPSSLKAAGKIRESVTGVIRPLLAVMFALPWLIPTHSAPWTTFYSEMCMAAVVAAACFSVIFSKRRLSLDWLSAAFIGISLIPVGQAIAGLFIFPNEAPLVSLYLLGFGAALVFGRYSQDEAPFRLINVLFASFVIGGLVSTGIALCQWLNIDSFGILLAPMVRGDRPIANVGQPNNLATLLAWGLVGLWWCHRRQHIGPTGVLTAVGFLLFGVALTASRTGFLEVVFLGIAAACYRRQLATQRQTIGFVLLGVWFLTCVGLVSPLSQALHNEPIRLLTDMASPRERTELLRLDVHAIINQPLWGYGWNQNITAHVSLADQFVMHGKVGNAHNLILDLLIWNGVPIGGVMVLGLGIWFWKIKTDFRTAEEALLFVAIVVLLIHTMLELPHMFAYFSLPAALMMGTLNSLKRTKVLGTISTGAFGAVSVVLAMGLIVIFDDYRKIEINGMQAEVFSARIAGAVEPTEPHIRLLSALQDILVTLRTPPRREMTETKLEHFRRAVTRYPSASGLLRYAQASALNNHRDDSEWALATLCSLHSLEICRSASAEWRTFEADNGLSGLYVSVPADATAKPLPHR